MLGGGRQDDELTDSGVYIPLTEREHFIAPVFSTNDYFSRLTNRILTPVLAAAAKQSQQQQQNAAGKTNPSSSSSSAATQNRAGAITLQSLLAVENPMQIAEQLVDLQEEALEMLEKLRLDEQRRLADFEKGCSITESHVRANLSATRDQHCVSTVATLNKMEAVAHAALTITASVRAEMAAASSRIARGYHVLSLFEIFDACTALDEDMFQNMLAELGKARSAAREAVIAGWKARGAAGSSAGGGSGGGGGQKISAAAVHGALYIQPPTGGARKAAPGGDDGSGGGGVGGGGESGAFTSDSSQSPEQILLAVEQEAIDEGFPEILARRSNLPEAIDIICKLLPLAESVADDNSVPEAANILEYEVWLRQQLSEEAMMLMYKFAELHDLISNNNNNSNNKDDDQQETMSVTSASRIGAVLNRVMGTDGNDGSPTGSSGSGAGSELAARRAENRRLILLNSVFAKLLLASLDFITRLHMQCHGNSHEEIVAQLQDFLIKDLKKVSEKQFPVSHAPPLDGTEWTKTTVSPTTKAAPAPKDKDKDKDSKDDTAAAAAAAVAESENANNNLSPAKRLEKNTQEVAAAFDYFIFELLWDLAMIESMFAGGAAGGGVSTNNRTGEPSSALSAVVSSSSSSSFSTIRAGICLEIMQKVVRDYTQLHLTQSEARKTKLLQQIEKLSATQARHHAAAIVAELNYHNEVLAVFLSQCRRLQHAVSSKFGDLQVPTDTALQPIYAFGQQYAQSEAEFKQLSRALQHLTEQHTSQFAIPFDGTPYDLVGAHEEVMKSALGSAESSLKRAAAICGAATASSNSGSRIAVKLGIAFQSYVCSFIERELQKGVDLMRKDCSNWPSWPSRLPAAKQQAMFSKEAAGLAPSSLASSDLRVDGDALFCGMRIYRWGLSSAARLSRFMQQTVVPLVAPFPDLLSAYHVERARLLSSVDRVGGELLTYIATGITTRSLAVLTHLQDYKDFVPVETEGAAEFGASGTIAGLHFRRFLAFALEEAEPLLKQLSVAAAVAAEERASGWDRQRLDAQLASRRRGDGLRRVLADPKAVAARSFMLNVGCGLFRGLCSHLRSYNVNDIGVLIMKRDVALYRDAVSPLFRHASAEDVLVLEEMFDVIRELMNLLLVPLDNIRNVKVTGLLREIHHKDILEFLQMRRDIGTELAKTLKL